MLRAIAHLGFVSAFLFALTVTPFLPENSFAISVFIHSDQ